MFHLFQRGQLLCTLCCNVRRISAVSPVSRTERRLKAKKECKASVILLVEGPSKFYSQINRNDEASSAAKCEQSSWIAEQGKMRASEIDCKHTQAHTLTHSQTQTYSFVLQSGQVCANQEQWIAKWMWTGQDRTRQEDKTDRQADQTRVGHDVANKGKRRNRRRMMRTRETRNSSTRQSNANIHWWCCNPLVGNVMQGQHWVLANCPARHDHHKTMQPQGSTPHSLSDKSIENVKYDKAVIQ